MALLKIIYKTSACFGSRVQVSLRESINFSEHKRVGFFLERLGLRKKF